MDHSHHAPAPASVHSSHSNNVKTTGHDKHAGHHTEDFLKRFIICVILTVPVLALSQMIGHWSGIQFEFNGDRHVLALLYTFIFIYGGYPFLKGLVDEIKSNAVGMMTLIGIAITVSWAYSMAITLGLKGMDFYWEMATLIDIMLIGHYLEMKSVSGASRSLELLVKM